MAEYRLKNNQLLLIEEAVPADAAELIAYLNQVGGESDNLLFGENGFQMSVEAEEQFLNSMAKAQTSAMFVGRVEGEMVTVGSVSSAGRERIAHQGEIALTVKKKYWSQGIGTLMMQTFIDFAKANGVTKMLHLGVRADNGNAQKLYKKMGFTEYGRHPRFFKINDEYCDEILMCLDITKEE